MKKSVFVLMPFSEEDDAAYRLFIKPALEGVGFRIERADDLLSQQNIMRDVISSIAAADLVVADLTASNPNVFYELGIAHALEKNTILLTQSVDDLPFDVRSYRVIAYQTHFAKIEDARKDLARLAEGAYEGTALFGNPVTDFRAKSSDPMSPSIVDSAADNQPDDRGFIDHLIEMGEGYGKITELINRSTQAVVGLTPKTQELAIGIKRAKETGGQLAASQIRLLCQRYASSVEAYAAELKEVNDQYEIVADGVQDSLEFVVRSQRSSLSDPSEMESLLNVLRSSRASAGAAREAYVGAREGIASTLEFERSMRRSGLAWISTMKN